MKPAMIKISQIIHEARDNENFTEHTTC